jgi:hypothetical protein
MNYRAVKEELAVVNLPFKMVEIVFKIVAESVELCVTIIRGIVLPVEGS